MRIARDVLILTCVLLGAVQLVVAGQRKYGVTVITSKPAALVKARTYAWTVSQPSPDKNVDALIVAAVDRELGARGFTKVASGQSDVLVTYISQRRTDVDLKKAKKGEASPEYAVGALIVDLSDPTNRQALFRVRMDTPLESDPATYEAAIGAAVKAMFEKYPPPPKR